MEATHDTPYELNYALRMLRQALDFAEAEGDFAPARRWVNGVERAIKAELGAGPRTPDERDHQAEKDYAHDCGRPI